MNDSTIHVDSLNENNKPTIDKKIQINEPNSSHDLKNDVSNSTRKSSCSKGRKKNETPNDAQSYSRLYLFKNLSKEELLKIGSKLPLDLQIYDVYRTPRILKTSEELALLNKKMRLSETGLTEDLSCPICIGTCQNVAVVKDCLHRFCEECIERWLRTGHLECPKCRQKIPSRRSLRADPIFERIVSRLVPNVSKFEELNDRTVANANYRRVGIVSGLCNDRYECHPSLKRQRKLSVKGCP